MSFRYLEPSLINALGNCLNANKKKKSNSPAIKFPRIHGLQNIIHAGETPMATKATQGAFADQAFHSWGPCCLHKVIFYTKWYFATQE